MGESVMIFKCIVQLIEIALSIITLLFLAKIYNGTKENPLEVYDKSIYDDNDPEFVGNGDSDNNIPSNVFNAIDTYCQCGENITNNICTEEQINEGCSDIPKNNDNPSLRFLDNSICDEVNKTALIENGEFSKVFVLHYDTVHKMALGIVVVLSALGISLLITVITQIGVIICGEKALLIIAPFAICIICVGLFAGLTNFILFIIMLVKYYKGKTTGEFLDFYEDCLDEDEQLDLEKTYNKLHDMNKYMTAFVASNFIQMAFNLFESCFSYSTREKNKSYGKY